MEMIARVTIRGAKTWVGNMDGKQLDTGKIYTDVELRGEDSKGTCTQELEVRELCGCEGDHPQPVPVHRGSLDGRDEQRQG